MSDIHQRREENDDVERNRYRDRRRSRSRTPERHSRRRRSRSRDQSSGRHYHSSGRDNRGSRYRSRRHSVSRSRSRSHSRSYSRVRKDSRTPTNSYHRRRSPSNERKVEAQSHRKYDEFRQKKYETSTLSGIKEGIGKAAQDLNSVEHLPLPPKREAVGAYYNLDTEEPIDKEKIHREIEEKLRAALAKEGKVYPPPKPEASHPVFANDGSFIEIFKKLQQAQQPRPTTGCPPKVVSALTDTASTSVAAAYVAATSAGKPAPPPPLVGRRRGGKILKTGMVAKPKAQGEESGDPKDFWSIYLREVNKYKNNACDSDGGTRPLVK